MSPAPNDAPRLRRALKLRDLVVYGIILIQPTAPLPIFGVIAEKAHGHVVTTILLAMVAMLFTAMSYGQMARAYPSAGSAYSYVGREINPLLGQLTGWMMTLDYLMNPIISVIFCSVSARNLVPEIPFPVWACFFAVLFTWFNSRGIKTSARMNQILITIMSAVIVIFMIAAFRYLFGSAAPQVSLVKPFFDPATFSLPLVASGASIAALTYIGFDGVSTLSEEVENPRRNIMLATVLTCLVTGLLASAQVYVGQLVWPDFTSFPNVETAFSYIAGRVGGDWLFYVFNGTLLLASLGSGMGAQLGAARLLYAMGRENVLPKGFFGVIDAKRQLPLNNVLTVGVIALAGAFLMDFALGCELLNFGAFVAFMGVNLAAFLNGFVRAEKRIWWKAVCPLAGILFCGYLWLSLGTFAKVAGLAWVLGGLVLFAVRRYLLGIPVTPFVETEA
ncbi:MAG TPA: APC family permease [Lacunisphaera sp.]